MSAGSMPERSTAARTAKLASVGPGVMLSSPRCDLVSGVRAVETMTAWRMVSLLGGSVRIGVEHRPPLASGMRCGRVWNSALRLVEARKILALGHQLFQQGRGL